MDIVWLLIAAAFFGGSGLAIRLIALLQSEE